MNTIAIKGLATEIQTKLNELKEALDAPEPPKEEEKEEDEN